MVSIPHPTSFLMDEMISRKMSRDDLAKIVSEKTGESYGLAKLALDLYWTVGPFDPSCRMGELAEWFSLAFGISKDYFLNLEKMWMSVPQETRHD